MRLIGRYDSSSIDLEGAAEDLRSLSLLIREYVGSETLSLARPSAPSSPYMGYVQLLRLEQRGESVCISRNAAEVVISGPPEKLVALADSIEHLANQQSQSSPGDYKDHVHIEYYPEHFYLSEESVPLVVTKTAPTGL